MKRFALTVALVALAASGCTARADEGARPLAAAGTAAAHGPALWKVADADTTIYLFGTVHALPQGIAWYGGEVATALQSADELVTEIPPGAAQEPGVQDAIGLRAILPPGETLRARLTPRQRATYEAALRKLGLEVDDFDRFKPWFVAMTLAGVPLLKGGYVADSGVERVLEAAAPARARRGALETLDGQISVFDTLPDKAQVAFLATTAEQLDLVVPRMDAMVAKWLDGDADALARLMNEGLDDATLADALLYRRNATWAEWIARRLDQPGTVFIAVGAGHLAGSRSVQDDLARRGIAAPRVQ